MLPTKFIVMETCIKYIGETCRNLTKLSKIKEISGRVKNIPNFLIMYETTTITSIFIFLYILYIYIFHNLYMHIYFFLS